MIKEKIKESNFLIILFPFLIVLSALLTLAPVVVPKILGANIPTVIIIAYSAVVAGMYVPMLTRSIVTSIEISREKRGNKERK